MKIYTSKNYGSSFNEIDQKLSRDFHGIHQSLQAKQTWGAKDDRGRTLFFVNGYVRITAKGLAFGYFADLDTGMCYALLGAYSPKLVRKISRAKTFSAKKSLQWIGFLPNSCEESVIRIDVSIKN